MNPNYMLVYSFMILGSYSIGYGLIRIGFPRIQQKSLIEKIGFGFIGGLVLFLIPFLVIDIFDLNPIYYSLVCLINFFALLLILFLKRTIFNENDPVFKKEKVSEYNKNQPINYKDLIKETKTINESKTNNINDENKEIKFDQGLMVKSRNRERQVFKEEKSDINKKTTPPKVQKESIMTRLREYAQDINNSKQNKSKIKQKDEIEEDEELMELIKDD